MCALQYCLFFSMDYLVWQDAAAAAFLLPPSFMESYAHSHLYPSLCVCVYTKSECYGWLMKIELRAQLTAQFSFIKYEGEGKKTVKCLHDRISLRVRVESHRTMCVCKSWKFIFFKSPLLVFAWHSTPSHNVL
jgi:hypothetical protein